MYLVDGSFQNLTENDVKILTEKGFNVQKVDGLGLRSVSSVPVQMPKNEAVTTTTPNPQNVVGDAGLIKMYTFQLPSNPSGYDVAFGGASYLSVFAIDAAGNPVGITSPNFPTSPIRNFGNGFVLNPLQQFAVMLIGRPHLIIKARISFNLAGQDANPMVFYSSYDKNGLTVAEPSIKKQYVAPTFERSDNNTLAAEYNFDVPALINERNMLIYSINAGTAVTLQLGILDVAALGDSGTEIETFAKKSLVSKNLCF